MSAGWPFKLPDGWETQGGGGYFPHLVHLHHTVCGMTTAGVYDLGDGMEARRFVYGHEAECLEDEE